MLKLAFSLISPAGPSGRLNTFIFHRVFPKLDILQPGEPDAAKFRQMLQWITTWFNVLPLDEAINRLRSGTLPSRAAAISFDDGYADNYAIALPILKDFGISAAFFIATGFLDGGRMWNDTVIETIRSYNQPVLDLTKLGLAEYAVGSAEEKQSAIAGIIAQIKYLQPDQRAKLTMGIASTAERELPENLMMTSDQVIKMREAGMVIGAHTVSHPILARLNIDDARYEMENSKIFLQGLLGERVSLFAYPNGKPDLDYFQEHAQLAENIGYDAAVSTGWGVAKKGGDPFQIPRFTPWDKSKTRFGIRLISNNRQI
jgi:peptidoglycan/xylan/chitin deacetylase (PgdA/CDA1 family)